MPSKKSAHLQEFAIFNLAKKKKAYELINLFAQDTIIIR